MGQEFRETTEMETVMTQTAGRDALAGVPSLDLADVLTAVGGEVPDGVEIDVVLRLVTPEGDLPADLGVDRATLERTGFRAAAGSTLVLPGSPTVVLAGLGDEVATVDSVRDAVAAATRASASWSTAVAVGVPAETGLAPADVAGAVVEGVLLARYRYRSHRSEHKEAPLERLTLLGAAEGSDAGVTQALRRVRAAVVARDLANTPPGHLTATDLGDVALALGERFGFEAEVLGRAELTELGCGGILGVNAGSAEEPRLLVLRYRTDGATDATPHLGLVGKGIMYDSGGISLKPSEPMHLLMKMDMGGAAAVLGAFTGLRDGGVASVVTAWLCCTDNMPSGTAYKLGDVLTARGGRTVEVKNTDAEGRLVMMDGIALANEAGVDAILDIATLTGAALMALGKSRAALYGNDDDVLALVERAAVVVDEQVWQMPLERRYRKQLDSDVADIANLGGPFAGATTAALFLAEFVGETPWAHLDIAGTMQTEADDAWRSAGATGYGARLLLEAAQEYGAPV